jgi:hypothetical protein
MAEEDNKGYISIEWVGSQSNNGERIQADSIGAYAEIPGFLVAYREGSDVPVGLYNSAMIKAVRFLDTINGEELYE